MSDEDKYPSKSFVKFFSKFPTIDKEFNACIVDCIRFNGTDTDEQPTMIYNPMVRLCYLTEAGTMDYGFTIFSGAYFDNLQMVSQFVKTIVEFDMYKAPVHALGTIYNEQGEEVEDINWPELAIIDQIVVQKDNVKFLH